MPSFTHLGFVFQVLVLAAIGLVIWQMKLAKSVDELRHYGSTHELAFKLRRGSMFVKLAVLCWAVAYGYDNGWEPWPPIVIFMAAADVNIMSEIMVLRKDLERLRRLRAVTGATVID